MKKGLLPVLGALSLLMSGCATIIDGTSQKLTVQTHPAGAEVLVNGQVVGTTPVTVDVKRAKNTVLTVKKEGFDEQSLTLATKLNSAFWGNAIIGGLPGSTTDAASGASIEYTPGNVYFELEEAK